MKTVIITLISSLLYLSAFADQEPKRQKVYSLVKQKQTTDWYKEQADLWETHLESSPDDGDAWLNYYTATRMLKIYQQGVSQEDLNNLVDKMEKAIPESFEYHYVKYWNGGNGTDPKLVDHLKKAYEIDPDRPELHDDFMTYYELQRDTANLQIIAKRWFASNDISPGLYAWSYNMLQTTEPNAILFTVGDNDTYPAIVLQHAKGIRKDVAVLNTSLLFINEYRNLWLKELNMPAFDREFEDYKETGWKQYQAEIIEHFKSKTDRPIYFAISANTELYESFRDEIHNVGMAYKWSKDKFDNIAVIKKNYEKVYLTDYLKAEFQSDISQGVVDHINANYLISLLTLYNHYEESEDARVEEVELLINRIAEKSGMQDKVESVLNKEEPTSMYVSDRSPKDILKNMVRINDTLYAGAFEVTNEDYMHFMATLLRYKQFDLLSKAQNPEVDWKSMLPEEMKSQPDHYLFKHGNPKDDKFPVVNISKEAAEEYCKWLTNSYNTSKHRKKEHNNVLFRLPSEKEWEYLAKAGKEQSAYAWGGPYVRNSMGCFLANLDVSEVADNPNTDATCANNNDDYDKDGGYFPVVAGTYFPNDYGLYNMTGNVAEMVKEKGIAKGGSWNTKAGIATIDNKEPFTSPNAMTGFRVIMIVNE